MPSPNVTIHRWFPLLATQRLFCAAQGPGIHEFPSWRKWLLLLACWRSKFPEAFVAMAPVRGQGHHLTLQKTWEKSHDLYMIIINYHDSCFLTLYPSVSMLSQHLSISSPIFPRSACTVLVRCQQMGSAFHSSNSPEDNSTATIATPCKDEIREDSQPNNPKGQAAKPLWKSRIYGDSFSLTWDCESAATARMETRSCNQDNQGPSCALHLNDGVGDLHFVTWCRHDDLVDLYNTLIQTFISMWPPLCMLRGHLLWQQKPKARDQSGWLLARNAARITNGMKVRMNGIVRPLGLSNPEMLAGASWSLRKAHHALSRASRSSDSAARRFRGAVASSLGCSWSFNDEACHFLDYSDRLIIITDYSRTQLYAKCSKKP